MGSKYNCVRMMIRTTDEDIIAQLGKSNQADNRLSGDKESKEMQEKPLPSSSETMVYINDVRRLYWRPV